MTQPVVLDLFCGGGGAGMGYKRAGFEVIGVDNEDHSKSFSHVGKFNQMDWADGLGKYAEDADFIHASPPCQGYSNLTSWGRKSNLTSRKLSELNHERLIEPVRDALCQIGKPWIIENVEKAPLINPVKLCCWTFNYEQYRHRIFESGNLSLIVPPHRPHVILGRKTGHRENGKFHSVAGHYDSSALAHEVMDIYWMRGMELSESIPPYFTEFFGVQILKNLGYSDLFSKWRSEKLHSSCCVDHEHEDILCLLQGGQGPMARDEIWSCPQYNHRFQKIL